jgi:ubiquinone/menaquinone biosynthesis C-methylase UbiE
MSHFHQQAPSSEQTLETTGIVIHWTLPYDLLFDRILRSSEASIRSLAGVKPGDKILDAGCGSGRLTIAAQNWVGPTGEAQGIDPSQEMINQARKKAGREGIAAQFRVALVEAIPFPDATFDVVMSRLVMHHLPGDLKQRGLAEMKRVLKPGGLCLIVDFEPPKSGFLHMVVENHMSPMAQVDVRNYLPLLVEAGFVDVGAGPTASKLLSYARGRLPS